MAAPLQELEGTWEEVAAHAPELTGRRVKLILLPAAADENRSFRPASGRSLLRHAGTWEGDDFEECLNAVLASRGTTRIQPEFEDDQYEDEQ